MRTQDSKDREAEATAAFFPGALVDSMFAPGGRQSGFCLGRRPLLGNREISKVFGFLVGLKRQNWSLEGPIT